jgi:hypothetical protein
VCPLGKRLALRAATRSLSSSPEYGMYPGDTKIPYVSQLKILTKEDYDTIPAYRVMDEDGSIRADANEPEVSRHSVPT